MKKRVLRILLPVFLLALCIINTKMPTISSTDRNNTVVQILPYADNEDDNELWDK